INRIEPLTPCEFTYICEPDVLIKGTVTADDGQPIPDVTVSSGGYGFGIPAEARTDEQGRYELRGVPRGTSSLIKFSLGEASAFLPRTININVGREETEKTLDALMKQGIVVSGRVTDPLTGN